ncbi:MAG TPA: TonB-dependent receptor [Bryobacteraceae bacterium]|nr:TonB-dependent receptor [Bryobacteraceae bacterium]
MVSRCVLMVFFLVLTAVAQTFQGNLAGVVTDPADATVPGATVDLESPTTGLKRTTMSTNSGIFLFADVPVGLYTITVNAKGFQARQVNNIEIAVSKTTDLNVRLEVSQVNSSVEVAASQVTLDTTTSALVAVVDSKIVTDIPINGRDYRQMFLLAPGIAAVNSPNNPSLNGTRTEEINYQIDGVDDNDGKNIAFNQGLGSVYLPIEAIDQLSVQSNAESDMGRNAAGNINVVIKSGTNHVHGSLYEFNRNEALAAYSPLQAPGTPKQEIRNNQFGFSLGGPLAKNKTFFYMNGEEQLAITANSVLDTSPSAAWESQATAVLQKYGVPANPVSMNLLNYWPANTRTGPATTNNWFSNAQNQFKSWNGVVRVDHHFNDKHSMFARYAGGYGWQSVDAGSHFQQFFQVVPSRVHNFAAVETDQWSPRLLNQITVGVTRFLALFNDADTNFNPIADGLNTGSTLLGSPTLSISGFDVVGKTAPLSRIDHTDQLTDALSYITGRHQFKFGGEYRRVLLDAAYFTNGRGTFNFDGSRGPWSSDKTLSSPLRALADFLAGYPSNSNGATITLGNQARNYISSYADFWVHDDFRATSELSLNFGLRYSYMGEMHDPQNDLYNFTPTEGFKNGPLYNNDLLNFAPRVGFSYAPRWLPKTVIRGGYGINYDTPSMGTFVTSSLNNGGASEIIQNPAGNSGIYAVSASNVVFQPGVPIFGGSTPAPPYGVMAMNRDFTTPHVHNYNLTVQHELSPTTILQVGFVGSQGRKLQLFLDINQPINGVHPLLAQYPTLGTIDQWNTIAFSDYASLQASVRKRLSKGLTANFNYTWGHEIDDATDYKPQPANSYNLANEKGPGKFDARQTLSGFVTYDVPQWAKFTPRLTKGWQLNSLFTVSTGSPVLLLAGKNVSGTGENEDRPDLVGNPFANVPKLMGTTAVQYFNPAAFAMPAAGSFGNLGRDAVYGPGFGDIDFSAFKRTAITERIGTEFRVEIFNLTNRINWANPGATLTSGSFGQLTSTKGGKTPGLGYGEPRNVQLGLRITF